MPFKSTLKTLLATSAALFIGHAGLAQDVSVKLTSVDGTATFNGDLVDFTDGFYTVRTDLGIFRVAASRMTCEGSGCPEIIATEADVIFAGSDTVGEGLMPLLMAGFANSLQAEADLVNGSNPGEVIASLVGDDGFGDDIGSYLVKSTGSGDAFKGLLDKSANIGMSSRRIRREEAKSLRDAGAGNMVSPANEHVIAVDSIATIVNPSNPISTLSIEQLSAIYVGTIKDWSEVGGTAGPINVISLPDASGTRGVFEDAVHAITNGETSSGVNIVSSNTDMAAAVNDDPNAVGYVGFAFQRGAKSLDLTNECGIVVTPSSFTAKTEEYPLKRRLYLYNRADNLPEQAQAFLEYAKSQDADGVIAKSGFIDLGVERVQQDFTGNRMKAVINNTNDQFELALMRELLVEMLQWDRLSTTLRFKSGSTNLDQKALGDVARLVDYLKDQPEGTEVAIVGFTDSDGAFDANRSLSYNRSQQALNSVRSLAGDQLPNVSFVSKGFGELSPSACNSTTESKAINRRVELWVRSPA